MGCGFGRRSPKPHPLALASVLRSDTVIPERERKDEVRMARRQYGRETTFVTFVVFCESV